jgi:hypothetical protein
MRRKKEQDEFIDQAIEQSQAPAPQPVNVPAPQAATIPIDPLTPPQPGMVPIGWMWPQQSAVAQAMDTGDVEMAGMAPDGGAIDAGEPDMPEGEDEDMFTDEEKEVIEEYRKWKANRVKENKKIKEEEDEDMEMEPVMPEEVALEEPPVEDEDMIDDDELIDEDEDFMDEFEDIVIDINELFSDLGGDVGEVIGGEEDELVDEEEIAIDEEEVVDEEMPKEEIVESTKKKKVKEEIKYPAGDPKREKASEDIDEFMKTREAQKRRRELIRKLREKRMKEKDAQEIVADATEDPDVLDKDADYDSVQSVIDKIGESRIKQHKQQEAFDKKFLEKFEEKKQLNWKKLLENGLLG